MVRDLAQLARRPAIELFRLTPESTSTYVVLGTIRDVATWERRVLQRQNALALLAAGEKLSGCVAAPYNSL
jgi:hypothetical protein